MTINDAIRQLQELGEQMGRDAKLRIVDDKYGSVEDVILTPWSDAGVMYVLVGF